MTDEHLRNLGRVAATFQAVEIRVAIWAWSLIGSDQAVGRMVTSQLPFGKLCLLAETLFQYRFPDSPTAVRFSDLMKRSLKAEEHRNQLFHSAWTVADAAGTVFRVKSTLKMGRGLFTQAPPVMVEEIVKVADELRAIADDLEALIMETIPEQPR